MANTPEADPRHNHAKNLGEATFERGLAEARMISELPGSNPLRLYELSVFDDSLGDEGPDSRIVGKVNYISAVVGSTIEVSSVDEPGVEFRLDNNGETDRLLADVSFHKVAPGQAAILSGNIRFLGSQRIQLFGERSIDRKHPKRDEFSHEIWRFAGDLGLESLWSEHGPKDMHEHKGFNRFASERMGRSIAKALKQLREGFTE